MKIFDLDADDRFLILASDGLWDELKVKDIEEIVLHTHSDKVQVIDQLFRSALKNAAIKCNKSEEDLRSLPLGGRRNFHDDISVVVVDLQKQVV